MESSGDITDTYQTPTIWPLLVGLFIVFVVWLSTLYFVPILSKDQSNGEFGDQFGAVNALFSGLAFSGVIYAIVLQRIEMRIALTELRATKSLIQEQQISLDIQNKAAIRRDFEGTFFSLLRFFSETTNNLDVQRRERGEIIRTGKDCFQYFWTQMHGLEIERRLSLRLTYPSMDESRGALEEDMARYRLMYDRHFMDLGHYFRLLFNIIRIIDESEIDDKFRYAKIIRAQLSDYEIAIIFYNGLSDYGKEKMKPLIEKYSLLKSMRLEKIGSLEAFKAYDISAYSQAPTYFSIVDGLPNQPLAENARAE